ncbi:hypothetical protein ACM1RC_30365 [Paenibacillus azoreducens]|uniref:hypothetical protein n=1 Tax=Paenibacillus azoreducens TaxID=116718 RepID=UPI0039F5458C
MTGFIHNATDEWVKKALRRHGVDIPENASIDDLRAMKEIEQLSLVEDGETLFLILSGEVIGKRLPVRLYADGTVYRAEYKYEIY